MDRMRNHFNKYKLIKGSQHGFTKGNSCLTNISEFYEAVSDWVDEGKAVDKAGKGIVTNLEAICTQSPRSLVILISMCL